MNKPDSFNVYLIDCSGTIPEELQGTGKIFTVGLLKEQCPHLDSYAEKMADISAKLDWSYHKGLGLNKDTPVKLFFGDPGVASTYLTPISNYHAYAALNKFGELKIGGVIPYYSEEQRHFWESPQFNPDEEIKVSVFIPNVHKIVDIKDDIPRIKDAVKRHLFSSFNFPQNVKLDIKVSAFMPAQTMGYGDIFVVYSPYFGSNENVKFSIWHGVAALGAYHNANPVAKFWPRMALKMFMTN